MSSRGSAIALGFFDGVHTAHQKLIRHTVEYSKENNLYPMVLSFDRSPLEVLCPERVSYLTARKEKEEIIFSLGAKAEFLNVSKALLDMEAEQFIKEILVKKYNVKYAVCGYNYRFGKGGNGNTSLLAECGEKYGFKVKVMDCEILHGEIISSSRIRKLIADGNIEEANELLGRSFSLSGKVQEGKHLGRKIGFPTANVFLNEFAVIPKSGVYKTSVTVGDEKYNAITNTGINPTVGGEKLRTETYIPHFDGNVYGKEMRIEFLEFIRGEKKFGSLDELKHQIKEDITKL